MIFLALLGATGEAWGGRPSCLKCHPPHYRSLGGCVDCHRGDPRSDRVGIAHHDLVPGRYAWFAVPGAVQTERGRRLMETFACRRCHTSAGKGNRLAGNLDRLPRGTTAQAISDAVETPALFMPRFEFDERQRAELVNAVLCGARKAQAKGGKGAGETPQVVHFQKERADRDDVFEKRCAPCHRVLTRSRGGLGRGGIGPDLSGLFSGYYPKSAPGGAPWSRAALKKWLENPRQSRAFTTMRPVPLPEGEFARLMAILEDRPE